MRLFVLKCLGLALWALFLFVPFIARAEEKPRPFLLLQNVAPFAAPPAGSHKTGSD